MNIFWNIFVLEIFTFLNEAKELRVMGVTLEMSIFLSVQLHHISLLNLTDHQESKFNANHLVHIDTAVHSYHRVARIYIDCVRRNYYLINWNDGEMGNLTFVKSKNFDWKPLKSSI